MKKTNKTIIGDRIKKFLYYKANHMERNVHRYYGKEYISASFGLEINTQKINGK